MRFKRLLNLNLWNRLNHSDALSKRNEQNKSEKDKQANERWNTNSRNFLRARAAIPSHRTMYAHVHTQTNFISLYLYFIQMVTMTTKTNLSAKPQQWRRLRRWWSRHRHIGLIALMTGKQTINEVRIKLMSVGHRLSLALAFWFLFIAGTFFPRFFRTTWKSILIFAL